MARKKDTPQKAALREMMGNYMKENNVKVKDGTDVNSIMRDMMSIILEGALDQEMDEELGYSKYDYRNKETDNSRNGHSQKTMHTSYGDMEIDIPRDRKGEFEPQIVKKYQNTVTQDMEEKIISMYAKGMTTNDIESHMRELYDIEISDSTISRITDKILPIVKEWQERPLEEIYAVVFMDAIHYHVRNEGRIVKRAVYIAIGIDMEGHKDVLGMYVGQNESAKFWLSILNGLRNRGVEDILIACVVPDSISGHGHHVFWKTYLCRPGQWLRTQRHRSPVYLKQTRLVWAVPGIRKGGQSQALHCQDNPSGLRLFRPVSGIQWEYPSFVA